MRAIKLASLIIATLFLLSALPLPLQGIAGEPEDGGDGVYENDGDWTIEEGEDFTYKDAVIIINGNLTIDGSLNLTRCHLIMNASASRILVNGTFELSGTNVSGNGTYYDFIVTGRLWSVNSNFTEIAGDDSAPFVGGLQIYSEDVHIDGGSIQYTEFTGLYLTTNITIWNLTIANNIFNVVMNASTTDFINCLIDSQGGSVNIFMTNRSHPTFIGGDQNGEIKFDDQNSSLSYGHSLHVHVIFENGTSIPKASVTATGVSAPYTKTVHTGSDGWVRNMILPEYTVHSGSGGDTVYSPYRLTAAKFGLTVMKSIEMQSDTSLSMVLTGDHFGEDLSRGDFNGDGLPDLAVGAPGNTTNLEKHGAVFIFLNQGDLEFGDVTESMADLRIEGEEGTGFGSILSQGDINGDGFDDLLIGAPDFPGNGPDSGRVYFFLGSSTVGWDSLLDTDLTLDGDPASNFGKTLMTLPLSGDIYDDVVIGDERHSYVFCGSADPIRDLGSGSGSMSARANHTLISGNLSSGDANGDGMIDVVVAGDAGNILYYGGPNEVSTPHILEIDQFIGNATRMLGRNGNMTLDKIGQVMNGDFESGWDNWSFVPNSNGESNAVPRLVNEEIGDWVTSPLSGGPTGGYGDTDDTLDGQDGHSSGMLRTDPFYLANDIEKLTLWYRWKVNSFDDYANEGMNIKLYRASDDAELLTIREWMSSEDSMDHEESGILNVSLEAVRGEMVYLAMETLGGDGGYDDALFQIDDVNLLPNLYRSNGTFESNWIVFDRNLQSYAPSWIEETNNGTIVVKFRTDPGHNWSEISAFVSGDEIVPGTMSDRLQYRIEMTTNDSSSPVLRDLEIGYLLEGQIVPLHLSTDYDKIKLGDVDGNGFDDVLFRGTATRGIAGIEIHPGGANLSQDFNASNIVQFYSGDVTEFSCIDLERDGRDEVVVLGEHLLILNQTGDPIWEKVGIATRVSDDAASDPTFSMNRGRIDFFPASDIDLRVIGIEAPVIADPLEDLRLNLSIGNIGMQEVSNVTLYLNITSPGYSHSLSQSFDLSSTDIRTLSFDWTVPEDEGKVYTLQAGIALDNDRVPEDNLIDVILESRHHGIEMSSPNPMASAHGGDNLTFWVILNNTGTFRIEDATFGSSLPDGWSGGFHHLGSPVDNISVTDSVELTFIASLPADESMGNFTLNISASAASANAWLDLTGAVLRPDLVVGDIALFRGDGVRVNDTRHAVEGDSLELRIKVVNEGPTYSTAFNLSTSLNDAPYQDVRCDGLPAGGYTWVVLPLMLEAGQMNITAAVDSPDEIPEADESNNDLFRTFQIKDTTPIGDYNFSGSVRNILGEGVVNADVSLEYGGLSVGLVTDGNGRFSHMLSAVDYLDAGILLINATDGNNVTNVTILTYSEDGGRYLVLTLNQYLVKLEGPGMVSTIDTGDNISLTVKVTNTGNIDAAFVLMPLEVPSFWNVSFPDLDGDELFLERNESEDVHVVIRSSGDPRMTQGFRTYMVSVQASAALNPLASDGYSHVIDVTPDRTLVVSVVGENTTEAEPFGTRSFIFMVENRGNVVNTFIPDLIDGESVSFEFDPSYVLLDISSSAVFTLNITMPNMPVGEFFRFSVGDGHANTRNESIEMQALEYYDMTCSYQAGHTGLPGESINIPLTITNTGNLQETISIRPYSPTGAVGVSNGSLDLAMGASEQYDLEAVLPSDEVCCEILPLSINLSCNEETWLFISVNITIGEVIDVELLLINTTLVPEKDHTTYNFTIEVQNTGDCSGTITFRAEGSHPQVLILPDPLVLGPHQTAEISVLIIVPPDFTGVVDNYLVPMIGQREFTELNLRILSYERSLATEVLAKQDGANYNYTIHVTNHGERFEELSIEVDLPDIHWESRIDTTILELIPGESSDVHLQINPPESKDYWGGDLVITLSPVSGQSVRLVLDKPPIAVLKVITAGNATIEDTLTFTGSQSYWNILEYHWEFGDGDSAMGSTVYHAFPSAGEFGLMLTVTDENNFTASVMSIVTIENLAPLPVITTRPLSRTVRLGEPITFDATHSVDRDGDIVSYHWDVGQLEERVGQVFQRTYDAEGEYEVTLTVTDNAGGTGTTTITVHVAYTLPNSSGGQGSGVETGTHPFSYLPAYIAGFLAIGMVIFLVRKRKFIRFLQQKKIDGQKGSKE